MTPRWLLLLLGCALFAAASAADLKLQLDAEQPVTVTLADGSTRELTAAEFEQLARERSEQQAQLQPKAEQAETRWQRQGLRDIETQDPQFALHIDLARRAFKELQRHGYARGYALSGFSEQEARPRQRQAAADYYVELVLTSRKDPSSGVPAKTGTGTRKHDDGPLSYEVQLLLDAQERFSVVTAWELSEKEPSKGQRRRRVARLSIQPTEALLERQAKRVLTRPAFATWLLAGGLALIAAGVLVMYNTRNPVPAPKPRRRSSDIWELVDENDKPIKLEPKKQQPAQDKKND
ncbi:uncharacterized protein IUM83_12986 [Phytophthora cinnamomi]|uniref:uncharacterized protein n=1 Tax=Phytophthora cinnamomi TaxID=4785 RepID=UPI0035594178|nr:hypothetical protein IUM83_12986 [Phytophthora cinnamomi]